MIGLYEQTVNYNRKRESERLDACEFAINHLPDQNSDYAIELKALCELHSKVVKIWEEAPEWPGYLVKTRSSKCCGG